MPNRNMQAKMMKARTQSAAYALDVADRESYRATYHTDALADMDAMVAAFYARKEAERAARDIAMQNIRAGLGQSHRPGLAAKYRR